MRRLLWAVTAGGIILAGGAPWAQEGARQAPVVLIDQMRNALIVRAPNAPTHVVERVLSFDVDGDERVSRDELPERMQDLIGRGDKDQDGFLVADEVRALTNVNQSRTGVSFRSQSQEGLIGVVNDLRLPQPKRDQALAIVKGHTVVRNVNDADTRATREKMRALLDAEEFENFEAAVARLGGSLRFVVNSFVRGGVVGGAVGGVPPPPPPPPPAPQAPR